MLVLRLLLLITFTNSILSGTRAYPTDQPISIVHVTVIDPARRSIQQDMTVVVVGSRIARIGKATQLRIPDSARVVDGRGQFLIPGLWDMHVHIFSGGRFPIASPMLIANGVTGVREMGTYVPLQTINGIRKQVADGKLLGPRIFAAGPVVDGRFKDWTNLNVTSAAEARRAVRLLKEQGADFIKVYDSLSRPAYFAIAHESRKENLPFVGHIPYAVSPVEAAIAGQKSIEHLTGILAACSAEEAEVQHEYAGALAEPDFSLAASKGVRADMKAADSYSATRCQELANIFRTHHIWQCPTLVAQRNGMYNFPSLITDWRLKYIPKTWRSNWKRENDIFARDLTATDRKAWVRLYKRWVEVARVLHRNGVQFLVGTDLGVSFIYPGFSLHDELELLVSAGLSPLEALQAATWNPAKFFGLERSLGTIEPGKFADLVLLGANPLEDIRNTRNIQAVVLSGRFFDRGDLDKFLAQAEQDAKQAE